MTKKLMSVAAMAALLSTGASAFNTNLGGDILATATVLGSYSADGNTTTAAADLNVTGTRAHGDALIYPYFTQKDGWSSEVYVRNDGNVSMVAKVALYAANDSEEIKDFNIYLSPNDVFRFKIHDNSIDLNEDSVVTLAPRVENNSPVREHSANEVKFGDTDPVTIPFDEADCGYVVIYGMAETNATINGDDIIHHNHVNLFGEYRKLLDNARAGWRSGFGPGSLRNFENGTYKNGITAPALAPGLDTNSSYTWNDPSPVLTGTIRVMHGADENGARDMLLPAVAMQNYTAGQIMAWTEGETASLADRRFDSNASTATVADYAAQGLGLNSGIARDALAFSSNGFYYRFDNASGSIANNLIFTQPLKRVLTQLGNLDGFWAPVSGTPTGFVTGEEYQFFTQCTFWDEKENDFRVAGGSTLITSPYNGTGGDTGFNKEIQVLKDADLETASQFGGTYDAINGYASCNLSPANPSAPAIVTQMVGTDVDGNALTNWIHSVIKD